MIRVGTKVRLKGQKEVAKVEVLLPDIKGGVRLDRRLWGFRYLNIEDLERADSK